MNIAKTSFFQKNRNVKIIYICAFLVYAVLTFIGSLKHEIWYDEAQAWNIARDNDIAGIFGAMKNEGHPALWHIILHICSRCGASASFLPFISWFFSLITVGIILWKSPLHPIMNLSMIFSVGFLYANTVISRVYCILQLILVVLACLYQKRKEHPVLYGLCIALLANTHIIMWGLIGALGIYMLIELFTEFKKVSKKENVLRITGLAIAGVGVLMLILPLIGCMTANNEVAQKNFTVLSIFESMLHYTNNVVERFISFGRYESPNYFLCYVLGILILLVPILLRHSIKHCIIFVSFMIGYFVASELIWYSSVNRSAIFIFVIFIIMWMIKAGNNYAPKIKQLNLKMDSKLLKKIVQTVINIDNKWFGSCCVILIVIMISSFPTAFYNLFSDYTSYFSVEKAAADYINENISKDALIVSYDQGESVVLSAYYPEYEYFSLRYNGFYSYAMYGAGDDKCKFDEIERVLSNYDEVYFVSWDYPEYVKVAKNLNEELLFKKGGSMRFLLRDSYYCIKKFNLDDFIKEYEEKQALLS